MSAGGEAGEPELAMRMGGRVPDADVEAHGLASKPCHTVG
jgi:hypothetical protein